MSSPLAHHQAPLVSPLVEFTTQKWNRACALQPRVYTILDVADRLPPANLYKFWYTIGMANPVVVQVHPLSEVRARLSGILARFRREGAAAEPVAFGSHRKPEAILIPYEAYERYEALARQRARLDGALSSAQSVQVELPGAFSPGHDREVSAYVDGEISAAELYRRTVARYRRP